MDIRGYFSSFSCLILLFVSLGYIYIEGAGSMVSFGLYCERYIDCLGSGLALEKVSFGLTFLGTWASLPAFLK